MYKIIRSRPFCWNHIGFFVAWVLITISSEKINFYGTTISDLKETLFQKHKVLKNKKFKVAQHNELNTDKTKVTSTEIALLPPFAGG